MTDVEDLRAIACECCGGDGCHEEFYWNGHEPAARYHRCTACKGTGDAWVETTLIDLEDFEETPMDAALFAGLP